MHGVLITKSIRIRHVAHTTIRAVHHRFRPLTIVQVVHNMLRQFVRQGNDSSDHTSDRLRLACKPFSKSPNAKHTVSFLSFLQLRNFLVAKHCLTVVDNPGVQVYLLIFFFLRWWSGASRAARQSKETHFE